LPSLPGNPPNTEIFLLTATGFFLWSDDFSVRTQDVDEQHKELITLINQLYVAINENRDQNTLREIFDQLTESAQAHFLFEESLMRLTQYAGYAAHKAQHEAVLEQLQTLQRKLDNESATISTAILDSHKHWWSQHISSSDQHFSTHYEASELARHAGSAPESAGAAQAKRVWWRFW
jgi:hemerythrin